MIGTIVVSSFLLFMPSDGGILISLGRTNNKALLAQQCIYL